MRDLADRCLTVADLLNTPEPKEDDPHFDASKYDAEKSAVLRYVQAYGFTLVEDGRIMTCRLQERAEELKPFQNCESWAIKGCPHYVVLRRKEQDGYEVLGRAPSIENEVDFYAKHKSVRISLV